MTNLRLMWVSDKSHRTNLCIGYNCIASLNIKEAGTRLRGANFCHISMHVQGQSKMLAVQVILTLGPVDNGNETIAVTS